jgi:hypothetical protein
MQTVLEPVETGCFVAENPYQSDIVARGASSKLSAGTKIAYGETSEIGQFPAVLVRPHGGSINRRAEKISNQNDS